MHCVKFKYVMQTVFNCICIINLLARRRAACWLRQVDTIGRFDVAFVTLATKIGDADKA